MYEWIRVSNLNVHHADINKLYAIGAKIQFIVNCHNNVLLGKIASSIAMPITYINDIDTIIVVHSK